MEEVNRMEIRKIAMEIRNKFLHWDANIRAGQQPVPIQDLDYWANELMRLSNL
jgi:hypothetical protein